MNKLAKLALILSVVAAALCSCKKEPTFITTDKGPQMKIISCVSDTYMGADIKFSVDVNDPDFALSTLKVQLFYDETEVSSKVIRTKTNGTYSDALNAPLFADIPDGTASLVFSAQNVGMGITSETVTVNLKRPNFDRLYLNYDGKSIEMPKEEGYKYAVSADFPAELPALITTPAINSDGDVITFGWTGSKLEAGNETPIPFSASIDGNYTVSVDLLTLDAAPFDYLITEDFDLSDSNTSKIYQVRQGIGMNFPQIADAGTMMDEWDLDADFIKADISARTLSFAAVDGYYKFTLNSDSRFIKIEPVDEQGNYLTLQQDGSGALWMIGANFGKPVIGPGWNTEDGAYPFAQVSPGIYQMTLNVGGQIQDGFSLKVFHQKGWGGEITSYASFDGIDLFYATDSGNIELIKDSGRKLTEGKAYRFTVDMKDPSAPTMKIKEIEPVGGKALDIQINEVKAVKLSSTVYKVSAVELKKGGVVSFSGIDDPQNWYIDPDHFVIGADGLKFNAVDGYYSIELNVEQKFVTVRRVKQNGDPATFADEGAITFMGWGVAHPVMTSQLAWDTGLLITMAEIEDGVYQFTGSAVEEKDGTTIGGRFRYDYLSFKFFGQAGWGAEMGKVTLTDAAKQYLKAPGNVELADGVQLEKGATYVLTVSGVSALSGDNKFDVTVDFQKK